MKANAPKTTTLTIALVLAIVALIAYFVPAIPLSIINEFWILAAGFGVLLAGNLFKGL